MNEILPQSVGGGTNASVLPGLEGIPLSMYDVFTNSSISEHALKRYGRDSKNFKKGQLSKSDQEEVLINALQSKDQEVQRVINALQSKDQEVQIATFDMVSQFPESEQEKVLIIALQSKDKNLQIKAIRMIGQFSEARRTKFYNFIKKQYPELYIDSGIYKNTTINANDFQRKDMEKNGGYDITLLGGKLKDKIILRHFKEKEFIEWKKLYENWEIRKEAGFDYVPIEPIVSFSRRKFDNVDVYVSLLDINYLERKKRSNGLFDKELKEDFKKINTVFEEQGFDHGHNRDGHNCVLRFFRKENGEIDFEKKPRMYVIDFDQVSSIDALRDNHIFR